MAWHQIYHKTLPELILNTIYDDILLCLYSREVGFTHVTICIWGITWYTFVPMQPIIYFNDNGNRIRVCGYMIKLMVAWSNNSSPLSLTMKIFEHNILQKSKSLSAYARLCDIVGGQNHLMKTYLMYKFLLLAVVLLAPATTNDRSRKDTFGHTSF